VDVDEDRGPKKKKTARKTASKKPQNPLLAEDEEEEGYTQRKIPALSMWYLPVVDHLHAIFGNPKDAQVMSWHASAERTKGDGKLQHPAGAQQWKHFDAKFAKEFGDEARNVKFTLSTDGMNPFGDLSCTHCTWPVILTIYSLPPHLCQKHRYLLLTCLISGPR
jgi:hypothetical protein